MKVIVDGWKGWGVFLGPTSPNGTANGAEDSPGIDPGCPNGCLFNLSSDPTEHFDLSHEEPELLGAMLAK